MGNTDSSSGKPEVLELIAGKLENNNTTLKHLDFEYNPFCATIAQRVYTALQRNAGLG